jgi:hypothetical protein
VVDNALSTPDGFTIRDLCADGFVSPRGNSTDGIVEPCGQISIVVHCLRSKKPPVEIRQVEVTYDPNLPYIGI